MDCCRLRLSCFLLKMLAITDLIRTFAVQDGTQKSQKVFMNIPTEVGATEAEAIGEYGA